MRAALKERYQSLSEQEQKAINMLGGFLIVLGCVLILKNVLSFYTESKQAYRDNQALLAWMHQQETIVSSEIKLPKATPSSESLISLVSRSAENHDLAFERIQPEGESKVRVYIENVRFDHLVSWFQELAELGLDIGNIRVEKTSSGYVNAQGVIGKDL